MSDPPNPDDDSFNAYMRSLADKTPSKDDSAADKLLAEDTVTFQKTMDTLFRFGETQAGGTSEQENPRRSNRVRTQVDKEQSSQPKHGKASFGTATYKHSKKNKSGSLFSGGRRILSSPLSGRKPSSTPKTNPAGQTPLPYLKLPPKSTPGSQDGASGAAVTKEDGGTNTQQEPPVAAVGSTTNQSKDLGKKFYKVRPEELQAFASDTEQNKRIRMTSAENWLSDCWAGLMDPPKDLSLAHFVMILPAGLNNPDKLRILQEAESNLRIARLTAPQISLSTVESLLKDTSLSSFGIQQLSYTMQNLSDALDRNQARAEQAICTVKELQSTVSDGCSKGLTNLEGLITDTNQVLSSKLQQLNNAVEKLTGLNKNEVGAAYSRPPSSVSSVSAGPSASQKALASSDSQRLAFIEKLNKMGRAGSS